MNPPRIQIKDSFTFTVSPSFSLKVPAELNLNGAAIIGVLGPNGAGKSTFLKVLADLVDHEAAKLIQKSINCQPSPVAWMPTQTRLAFEIQVADMILLGRFPLHKGYPSAADRSICSDIMAKLNILHLAERSYQSLSSGEQRKVSLARTLVAERDIVLLDEPLSHLDPKACFEMKQVFRQLKSDGKLVILSIHDINMAMRLCDQLLFITKGNVSHQPTAPNEVNPALLQDIYEVEFQAFKDPAGNHPYAFFVRQSHLVP